MRMKLAFNQTSDERFLVMAEVAEPIAPAPTPPGGLIFTTYDHEDTFLKRVIAANLTQIDTTEVVTTVLLAVARPIFPQRWVNVNLSSAQSFLLGLKPTPAASQSSSPEPAFAAEAVHFYDFLMQAPVPFVVLSGPEHRVTLINPPYINLISQLTQTHALGKTIREVIPELEGQAFFNLLDSVYRTGKTFTGHEILAHMRSPNGPGMEDRYFDFIYYPIPNNEGSISGIMIQASDVTERVLAHATTEHREEQLFRQWEELEKLGIEGQRNRKLAREIHHTVESMKSHLSLLQSDIRGPNVLDTLHLMQHELQQLSAIIHGQTPA